MKVNKGVIGVIVLGAALVGCGSGGLPEATQSIVREEAWKALVEFKNRTRTASILDKCNEINQGK